MKLNVLVVGTGMYVCGRGTDGYGTLLPALMEGVKRGLVGEIHIVARSNAGAASLKQKLDGLKKLMGLEPVVRFHVQPDGEKALATGLEKIPVPACAIISVPDHLHTVMTLPVLAKKIPPLVVKPLAPTVGEVDRLITAQQTNGVYAAVEFHKRFDRSNLFLRQVCREGRIGDLLYVLVEYSQRKQVPEILFQDWSDQTNIFQYLGIHYVDIIYFATGALPRRVMATGQKYWLKKKGIDTFDAIQVHVEWETSTGKTFASVFLTNWIDPDSTSAMSDQKIKIIGTKGRVEADQKNRGLQVVDDSGGIEDVNPDFCRFYVNPDGNTQSLHGYGAESVLTFLQDVSDIAEGKTTIKALEGRRPTFQQARVPTQVIEAAGLSLSCANEWVTIK